MSGGDTSTTRDNNGIRFRAAEIDRRVSNTVLQENGKTFSVGTGNAKAGSLGVMICPRGKNRGTKVFGRGQNIRVSSTLLGACSAVKTVLGLPEKTSITDLVRELKRHGSFVGVFPEDTSVVVPTALISGGITTVSASMKPEEVATVMPGQSVFIDYDTFNGSGDSNFGVTIYPPLTSDSAMVEPLNTIHGIYPESEEQTRAAMYLISQLRNAVRIAMAYSDKGLSAKKFVDIVIGECNFATVKNVLIASKRKSDTRQLKTAISAYEFTGFANSAQLNYFNAVNLQNGLLGRQETTTIEMINHMPDFNARVIDLGSVATKNWLEAFARKHSGLGEVGVNLDVGTKFIHVFEVANVGEYASVYIGVGVRGAASDVLPSVAESQRFDLPQFVSADCYMQAAISILSDAYEKCMEITDFDSGIPSISGPLASCVAHADVVAKSVSREEEAARQIEFFTKIRSENMSVSLQAMLTSVGISRADCNVERMNAPTDLTNDKARIIAESLCPYIGIVSDGHTAFRKFGSAHVMTYSLGSNGLMHLKRAFDSTHVGHYVGHDSGPIIDICT